MEKIELNGAWDLFHFQEGAYAIHKPGDLLALGLERIPAQVPGNVELDLCRAGIIPEPFYGKNIRLLRAYEDHEWWYQRRFFMPDRGKDTRWDLVFGGLDTLGTIWINDRPVGQTDNMLIPWRLAAEGLVPGAENTLTVRLGSVFNLARQYEYDASVMSWEHREEGLFIRKAPHVWGWDIMPRAVSAGIWQPVWLEEVSEHSIEQVYYWTSAVTRHGATLGVRFQFRTSLPSLKGLEMSFHGVCGEHEFAHTWPVEFTADGCIIPVPGAKLWWPKPYGDPHLYTVTVRLLHGGEVLAERIDRIGIRKLVVDRTETAGRAWAPEALSEPFARLDTPPEPDSHFVIRVNDVPVMVKGTNWVPLDAFHSRDAERLGQALDLVDDLGCNMIRCWGGNVYAEDAFFDFCDEKGILVWQDFAYACCRYPQEDGFLEKVRLEAESVVKRLRNHASLAVWCGDNEIDMGYLTDGLNPEQNRLTREVLPRVTQRCDPRRAYVPSSPYAPPAVIRQARPWESTPEQHLWGPRGYFKSPFYTRHSAHFIGEIGYHGCNNVSSIQKFISPEAVWPCQDNDEWQVHAVYHWEHQAIDRDRIHLMANQVKELFGEIPTDLAVFALASQITQAEAKKFFIESTRLRKWGTSGVLWWNVLDGWPQFSDAVVDYYLGKKLAYHYIWRSQRPVCLILGEAGTGKYHPVVVSNDTIQDAEVAFRVWNADGREVLVEGRNSIPANQNWQVGLIRTFASLQGLYLLEWEVAGVKYGSHYLAGTPPFSLERYRSWLPLIAALPRAFEASRVAL